VQRQTGRRPILVAGATLAILFGMATALLILALPAELLGAVVGLTGLSGAGGPISSDARAFLSVLTGVAMAGLGWLLVDRLLLSRIATLVLIPARLPERGDDALPSALAEALGLRRLADSEDSFRSPPSEARRPLSARSEIGAPPIAAGSPLVQVAAIPSLDRALPPIDQVLQRAVDPAIDPEPPATPIISPEPTVPEVSPVPAPAESSRAAAAPVAHDRPGQAVPASWPPLEVAASVPSPSVFREPISPSREIVGASPSPEARAAMAAGAPVMPSAVVASGSRAILASLDAGSGMARLEELLVQLERGIERRRAAAARALPPPRTAQPTCSSLRQPEKPERGQDDLLDRPLQEALEILRARVKP